MSSTRIEKDGRLVADTPLGALAQSPPVAWQEGRRGRVEVPIRYRLFGRGYGFDVASYDRSKPLYIDPILATTYVGGAGDENGSGLAIHPVNGDIYVTGYTTSTDFPGIAGGAMPITSGPVFVARYDRDLRTLRQATLLPASSGATKMAIHPASGDVYVIGANALSGVPASWCAGGLFVARLASDLRTLLGVTCRGIGGSGVDVASGVAVGPNGDVYVSGANFFMGGDPTTSAAYINPGLMRFGPDLAFKASSVAGGGRLAINPATGDIYALRATGGPLQYYIERLSPALAILGSIALAETYTDIAVQPATGDVYAVGYSFDLARAFDVIVARFDGSLLAQLQSASLAGSANDLGQCIAIDPATGDVFVAGITASDDLPGVSGGAQAVRAGPADGFIARFSSSLTTLRRATYFGGSGGDRIEGIVTDPASGDVIVSGGTASADLPATAGGSQPSLHGPSDAFISRLGRSLGVLDRLVALGGGGQRANAGYAYALPMSVRLLDVDNLPVAGAAVSFTFPASGPRAAFSGGGTISTAITDGNGNAQSPPFTAGLEPGPFVATATAGPASVMFDLQVDPSVAVVIRADHPLAILLCIACVIAAAAVQMRR